MTFEAVLSARHAFRYTTEKPVPVKDVIASLHGLQQISAHFLPRTLTALTGVEILGAELLVEGFEQGSFKEDVVIKLIFGSQEKLEAFLKKCHEGPITGIKEFVVNHKMISVSLGALILLGAAWAYMAMHNNEQAPSIQANNNVINIIGAEAYQTNPEAFGKLVAASVVDRKKLAEASIKVIAPAKNEQSAGLELDGDSQLVIKPEVIRDTPARVEFDEQHPEQAYPDVDLQIRAIDRDRTSHGWKGLIDNLVNKRVPLVLADNVDPAQLAKYATIRADVRVVYKVDKTGRQKPYQIIVDRLIPPDGDE